MEYTRTGSTPIQILPGRMVDTTYNPVDVEVPYFERNSCTPPDFVVVAFVKLLFGQSCQTRHFQGDTSDILGNMGPCKTAAFVKCQVIGQKSMMALLSALVFLTL